jgi:uncharacterized protein with HEPN domain
MSKRDIKLLLEDMLESAYKIKRYTSGLSFENFLEDEKTIDAVVRNFEIIGEVDWNRIRGFRNRIVHDYSGIGQHIVPHI